MRLPTTYLIIAGAALITAMPALAVPVHISNTDVTSWDVGSGQVNGNFSVTRDTAFTGGMIELGIRTEQRRIGAVVPVGDDYLAMPGIDPGPPAAANRAWWNFQLSIAYNGGTDAIDALDSLTLAIRKDAGSNVEPAPSGEFDLLALRVAIDDRNAPNSDASFSDIYQVSQNPLFGWFPGYSLAGDATFAYFFTLTAREGESVVSTSMCVHTEGLSCRVEDVPEPGTLGLLGLGVVGLGVFYRQRRKEKAA